MILKLLCIIVSAALLLQAVLLRRHSETWLTPAGLWSLLWFLFTFIPLIAAPEVPANPLAILFIVFASFLFALPVFQTRWHQLWPTARFDPIELFQTRGLRISFAIATGGALIALAINLSVQGVTLGRLSTEFLEVSNELIVDRYTDSTIDTIFATISNLLTYLSAALGGLVFLGTQRLRNRSLILIATMAAPLAQMSVAGAKGAIFLSIALFYGAFLAGRKRLGSTILVTRKGLVGLVAAGLLLIPFITVSFLARGLYGQISDEDVFAGLYRNFVSYSSAHVYAFSDWFSWYIGQPSAITFVREDAAGGFHTFYSIFKAMGSTRVVPPGFYDEYYQYSWYLQTNIYTVYRGLIADFTIVGAFLFMYVAGLGCNTIFLAIIRSERPSWSIATYIVFCGLAYTSFIISIFIWNTMYPLFVILGIVIMLNHGWFAAERNRRTFSASSMGLGLASR